MHPDIERRRLDLELPNLERYLEFLELTVLYDRLIVGRPDWEEFLSDADVESPAAELALTQYRLAGALKMSYEFDQVLVNMGILFPTSVGSEGPLRHVRTLISTDPATRGEFQTLLSDLEVREANRDTCRRVAEFALARDAGFPLFIGELSTIYGVPYRLADHEEEKL